MGEGANTHPRRVADQVRASRASILYKGPARTRACLGSRAAGAGSRWVRRGGTRRASRVGVSHSVWRPADRPQLAGLTTDTRADVCVVGGGIAGVAIAHELRRRGVDVVLLHDHEHPAEGGETRLSTAQLATALDRGYRELLTIHGQELTGLAAGSHAAAIDRATFLVEDRKSVVEGKGVGIGG